MERPIFVANETSPPAEHEVSELLAPIDPTPPTPTPSTPTEPLWRRALYLTIAICIAVAYFAATHKYWVPAHGGVDQNGYLVGARNLLLHHTMMQKPADAFGFVGRMWVTGIEPGTYYPKYPAGLPTIFAIALWAGGVNAVYLVNPVAMALALVATYLLVSRFAGPFYGVLGMLVMASSPVTTGLTNNPNSHATAVCCVAWGMFLLLSWWERPKTGWMAWLRCIGAGFLLGVAVTIRYTEGLLLLPLGIVAIFVFWDQGRFDLKNWWVGSSKFFRKDSAFFQSVALVLGWAVPVGVLLIVNWQCFGTWTGYDPTNESSGFTWKDLAENWDKMLTQLTNTGLVFIFPIAVAGLGLLFRYDVRRAVVITAWALPCLFLYTAYYWAPDTVAIGYTRFFLTIFPALLAAAAVALKRVDDFPISPRKLVLVAIVTAVVGTFVGAALAGMKDGWGLERWQSAHSIVGFLKGAGIGAIGGLLLGLIIPIRPAALVAVAGCAVAFATSTANFENDQRTQIVVQTAGDRILKNVPNDAVLFSKDNVMHHAQFLGDWQCYSIDLFNESAVRNIGNQSDNATEPQPFQAERAKALFDLLKDDRNPQLAKRLNDLMNTAFGKDQRVFLAVPKREFDQAKTRFLPVKEYDTKIVDAWDEPPNMAPPRERRAILGINRPMRRPQDVVNSWQIVEVTRKPPTTAPVAIRPTTRTTATKPVR